MYPALLAALQRRVEFGSGGKVIASWWILWCDFFIFATVAYISASLLKLCSTRYSGIRQPVHYPSRSPILLSHIRQFLARSLVQPGFICVAYRRKNQQGENCSWSKCLYAILLRPTELPRKSHCYYGDESCSQRHHPQFQSWASLSNITQGVRKLDCGCLHHS